MNKLFVSLVLFIVLITISLSSIFIVNQSTNAIMLKVGEIVRDDNGKVIVYEPGLHWKTPFINTIKVFDMKLNTLTIDSERVVTKEQKDVLIDAYAEWKIIDTEKFYLKTSGEMNRANRFLKQYVESSTRAKVGSLSIQDLIKNDRDNVMSGILEDVKTQAKDLGIHLTDVRIKQIDFPETVTESIYQRMRSARNKIAAEIRADGERKGEEVKAIADAEVIVIKATSESEAKILRAEGQAIANQKYVDTYSLDKKFFEYIKSLQAYKESFNKDDMFILKPEGKFFKYFNPENN